MIKLPQPKATKIQSKSLASTTAALTDQEIENTRKSIYQVIDTEFEKAVQRLLSIKDKLKKQIVVSLADYRGEWGSKELKDWENEVNTVVPEFFTEKVY